MNLKLVNSHLILWLLFSFIKELLSDHLWFATEPFPDRIGFSINISNENNNGMSLIPQNFIPKRGVHLKELYTWLVEYKVRYLSQTWKPKSDKRIIISYKQGIKDLKSTLLLPNNARTHIAQVSYWPNQMGL